MHNHKLHVHNERDLFLTAQKCSEAASINTKVPMNDASSAYLKTACFITTALSQSAADAYCKSHGMQLFVITDAYVQTTLFATLTTMAAGNPVIFRVDGIRDEPNGDWFNYSYGKAPVFAGLEWLQTLDTLTGYGTMIVENIAYPMMKQMLTWKVDGVDPTTAFPFICEFV